jgi:hypothetical protein
MARECVNFRGMQFLRRMPRILLVSVSVILVISCQWQLFESIEIRTKPTVTVPGGTIQQRISDIEQITDLEAMVGDAFDSGERIATDPYTYRGTLAPLSFYVDDFLTETGISADQVIDPFTVTDVDVSGVTLVTGALEIPLITGTGSAPPIGVTVPVPSVAEFIEATVGSGSLDISIGDLTTPLPDGTYVISVLVEGAEDPADSPSFGPQSYVDPGQISVSVPLTDLRILGGGSVAVTITVSWEDAGYEEHVPVALTFSFDEFSEVIVNVGPDPFDALELVPFEIPEEIRRQVERIEIDTTVSEIRLGVTADLLADVDLTLLSDALFDGGASNTETLLANTPAEQELVYPITASEILLVDPDEPGPPPGGAIDSVDLTMDIAIAGHDPGTGYLTLYDMPAGGTLTSTAGATAGVTLEPLSVTLRDVSDYLDEFSFELTPDDLSVLDELPTWLRFVTLPVRIAMDGTPDPADVPTMELHITATGDSGTDEVVFASITVGAPPSEQDLAPILNARPNTVQLALEPEDPGVPNPLTLAPGDFLSVTIEIDLVFDFQVVPETGDEVNLIEEFFDEESFSIDGDALGRAGPDDLAEVFDNVGSARLQIDILQNTTGLDGLRYQISEGGDWVISSAQIDEGTITIALTNADVERIRDTWPFSPTLEVFLERRDGTESYALNYDGEIEATVRLDVVGDVAYSFDLFGGEG